MEDNRRNIIIALFLLVVIVYAVRLFYLQIVDTSYKKAAANNSIQKVIEYPYRGLIYDRNGKFLVNNTPVFDINVIPKDMGRDIDSAGLCTVFKLTNQQLNDILKAARKFSSFKPSSFVKQLPEEEFARIQSEMHRFPGLYISPRTVRGYPHQSLANALGYIGEVSQDQLDRLRKQGNIYYSSGDYIGISGLEKQYETELRGKRGVHYVLVDVHGIQKGAFEDGRFDTTAVAGKNLITSVDLELQQYCEKLMVNKRGAIVAIEPETGEILAFVSSPSYDPNLLTGRDFSKNFVALNKAVGKPLFNRPLMAMYPPGSTFKVVQALIGQHLGVIDSNTVYSAAGSFFDCHFCHGANMYTGIRYSENTYFDKIFREILNQSKSKNTYIDTRLGYEQWRELVLKFGFGVKLGIDLPNEKTGIIPSSAYYDKVYGHNRWKYSTIYSLSIGQGEIGSVSLQLANLAAILANRGWYIPPHFVKSIGDKPGFVLNDSVGHLNVPKQYTTPIHLPIKRGYYDVIVNAMQAAFEHGTVWWVARMPDIAICGKTGTAQNPHGEDHSVFIGFAPRYNPKIAISVFVENGGWGGTVAAPMASLIIEKHIKGKIADRRKWIEDHYLEKTYKPLIEN